MTLPGIFNPGLPGSLPGGGPGGGNPTPTPYTTGIITQPTLLIQFDDEQCTAFSDNSNPTGPLGRTVTLTAVPKPGFVFGKWNFTDISPPTPTLTITPTPTIENCVTENVILLAGQQCCSGLTPVYDGYTGATVCRNV